ncbi:MAG: ATP-grasp domain-containing protein, partial [Verrucomicrobiae bacterium]|nr:ATP-grasp domain-containing protein [Verrucomicrobiae bacterium]
PEGWGPPVVIKPARQGSSVGLQVVDEIGGLRAGLEYALRFDTEALMEERIIGREATVGILDDRALPVIEVCPRSGVMDYHHKYTKGATEFYLPARFDSDTNKKIQEVALAAVRAVGARDYARVDVMVRPNGEPLVLEVNTLPGMTELSLLPKAAAAVGYSFAALCERMVELALRRTGSGA